MYRIITLLFMMFGLHTFAQDKNPTKMPQAVVPTYVRTVEGIKEYQLDNGLKVLLIPDATLSNCLVNIVYQVGSRHEGYGEKGMAHLLEHMLFKSANRHKDIKKAIADKGAQANGTTYYDRTNYYTILPSSDSNLYWQLDLEADRMVNAGIKKEELETEFSVVRNEFEIGENDPENVIQERVLSTMYLWHNYGNSTIGNKEDIELVPIPNLRTFYEKYYQPDNAVLVVAGKFDENTALDYIQKTLGAIPKPERVLQATYTVEPVQDGERDVVLRRNGDKQVVSMAYHTPCFADSDYAVNDVIIELLSAEGSGILYKELVNKKLASTVWAYSLTLHDPGFTYFNVDVPADGDVYKTQVECKKIMDNLSSYNFTVEDVQRAKTTLINAIEDMMNKTNSFGIQLTEFIGAGDYRLIYLYRDQLSRITIDQVKKAMSRYYVSSNRTNGIYLPDKAPVRAQVDNAPNLEDYIGDYKGKSITANNIDFESSITNISKNTKYGTLGNGIKYAILTKPVKGNLIEAQMKIYMGTESTLDGKSSVGQVCANMLMKGTKTKSQTQIKDALDQAKSKLNINFGPNYLSIRMSTDQEHLQIVMTLLQEILTTPAFSNDEFEKVILESKTNLQSEANDPQTVAFRTINKLTSPYSKGHPFYASSVEEALQDLSKVTLSDVKNFYNTFYGANEGYITYVGVVKESDVKPALTSIWGNWKSKTPYQKIKKIYKPSSKLVKSMQIDDKANAVGVGAINLPMSQQDANFPALFLANELMGGGAFLSSRIPQRLREAEGWSYGAGSYLNAPFDEAVSTWGLYAFFNPMYKDKLNTALDEEINKAQKYGFTQKELDESKLSFSQQRVLNLGNNNYLLNILNSYMEDGRQLQYYDEFTNKIEKTTLIDVNKATSTYLDLNKLELVYAGDFRKK